MDNFHEEVVKNNNSLIEIYNILSLVTIFISGFLIIQLILSGNFSIPILFFIFSLGLIVYGAYVYRCRLFTEFEYTYTNDELDIAKVIMNKRRKEIVSIDLKKSDIIAPVSSNQFQQVLVDKNINKTLRCHFSKDTRKLYYVVFKINTRKNLLIFEPSETLLEYFRSRSTYRN